MEGTRRHQGDPEGGERLAGRQHKLIESELVDGEGVTLLTLVGRREERGGIGPLDRRGEADELPVLADLGPARDHVTHAHDDQQEPCHDQRAAGETMHRGHRRIFRTRRRVVNRPTGDPPGLAAAVEDERMTARRRVQV